MADYPSNSTTKRSSAVKVMLHPDMAEKGRELTAEVLSRREAELRDKAVRYDAGKKRRVQ